MDVELNNNNDLKDSENDLFKQIKVVSEIPKEGGIMKATM